MIWRYCVLVFALLSPLPAATSSYTVAGAIHDPLNTAIPDASVTLYGPESEWRTSTDRTGAFKFKDIPQGEYDVEVISPGFTPVSWDNISVRNNVVLESAEVRIVDGCSTGIPNYRLIYRKIIDEATPYLVGLVKSEEGKLIRNAEVIAVLGKGMLTARSSKDGSFAFSVEPVKRSVGIVINARGFLPTQIPRVHLRPGRQANLALVMQKKLRGRYFICQ